LPGPMADGLTAKFCEPMGDLPDVIAFKEESRTVRKICE